MTHNPTFAAALADPQSSRSFTNGASRGTSRAPDQLARGRTRNDGVCAAMRLAREWQDRVHVVEVGEDEIIRWNAREWRPLSQVARATAGTRRSGLAFFGLMRWRHGVNCCADVALCPQSTVNMHSIRHCGGAGVLITVVPADSSPFR